MLRLFDMNVTTHTIMYEYREKSCASHCQSSLQIQQKYEKSRAKNKNYKLSSTLTSMNTAHFPQSYGTRNRLHVYFSTRRVPTRVTLGLQAGAVFKSFITLHETSNSSDVPTATCCWCGKCSSEMSLLIVIIVIRLSSPTACPPHKLRFVWSDWRYSSVGVVTPLWIHIKLFCVIVLIIISIIKVCIKAL